MSTILCPVCESNNIYCKPAVWRWSSGSDPKKMTFCECADCDQKFWADFDTDMLTEKEKTMSLDEIIAIQICAFLMSTEKPVVTTQTIGRHITGKVEFDSNAPEYRKVLITLNRLYEQGVLWCFYTPHDGNRWMLKTRDVLHADAATIEAIKNVKTGN